MLDFPKIWRIFSFNKATKGGTMGRTPAELLALADVNPELDQVGSRFNLRLQIVD
jgi:hypothetical protein